MELNQVKIRPAKESDISFIFNSWLQSFRDSPTVRGIPNTLYYKEQHRLIEDLLKRDTCRVILAVNEKDEEQIFGYIIFETYGENLPLVMHWIYVKHPFRNFKIGSQLIEECHKTAPNIVTYSHKSKLSDKLMKNRQHYIYNPYNLRG